MTETDVIDLYRGLEEAGVSIWIDGGWGVDAALGRQTRPHADLDIAIEAKSVPAFMTYMRERGFRDVPRPDASEWNFVVGDNVGRLVDVHVVVLDETKGVHAAATEGIAYPASALTGQGRIASTPVRCVHPDIMLGFKLSYPPRPIDRQDVAELCALLRRPVPDTHR